jgi:acetyl esterase
MSQSSSVTAGQIETALAARASIHSIEDLRASSRLINEQLRNFLDNDLPVTGEIHTAVPIGDHDGLPLVDVIEPPTSEVAPASGAPLLVYLHGGGWVMGSAAVSRRLACTFAERGFLVVNVDYRLAPENPFPAAYDDAVAAVRWALANATRYGGDPARVTLGGDSAGANLAAAVAVTAGVRTGGDVPVRALALFYGGYDLAHMPDDGTESTRRMSHLVHEAYLGPDSGELVLDPRVSPIHRASVLPPCFLGAGTADIYALESESLAELLTANGISHELRLVPDMPHGYIRFPFPEAAATIAAAADFLLLHSTPDQERA